MIQVVATIIEVVLAVLVASILFFFETGKNFSPVKNMKRAYGRVKHNIIKHQLD